jgi:hypothetical protein
VSRVTFEVLGARAVPYAAVPTLAFRLAVAETTGEPVHAIALRIQIQLEPRQRHYTPAEQDRLFELFGEPARWGETLRTIVWTHGTLMVPGFHASAEVDLPVTCTYDFEVAAAKYFHGLDEGEIPLVLLFSGTIFTKGQSGFSVEQIPWEREARYRLPVAVWRELMDLYYPDSAWLRLRREVFDELQRFKARRALPTWEDAIGALLDAAEREDRP